MTGYCMFFIHLFILIVNSVSDKCGNHFGGVFFHYACPQLVDNFVLGLESSWPRQHRKVGSCVFSTVVARFLSKSFHLTRAVIIATLD